MVSMYKAKYNQIIKYYSQIFCMLYLNIKLNIYCLLFHTSEFLFKNDILIVNKAMVSMYKAKYNKIIKYYSQICCMLYLNIKL